MNRRGLLSMMAGLATGWAGNPPARAAQTADDPLIERLTLFVPTTIGGGSARSVVALKEALEGAGLVRETAIIHAPAGARMAVARFEELAGTESPLLMGVGAGLIGGALLAGVPLEQALSAPVARLITERMVLAVSGTSDIETLRELILSLQLEPAGVSFVGGPLGSAEHMLVAALARHAGVDPNRISYRARPPGESAGVPVHEGKATCAVGVLSELQLDISLGRLRGLAISSAQRLPGVNIATFAELGVELQMNNWRGVFTAPQASPEQQAQLRELIARLVESPSWKAKIFQHNWMSAYLPMPAFAEFLRQDIDHTRRRLAELGLN